MTKNQKKNIVTVKGVLTRFRYERGYKGKGEKRWNVSIKLDDILSEELVSKVLELIEMDRNDTFTPRWLKEPGEYVNVHTAYDIPCDVVNGGKTYPLEMGDVFEGAEVNLALKCKKGAVYPYAIRVFKNGTPYNPFECFNGEGGE